MSTFLEKLNKLSGGLGRQAFNSYVLRATRDYQKKYGFKLGEGSEETHNNEADAFKHAYMQWLLGF